MSPIKPVAPISDAEAATACRTAHPEAVQMPDAETAALYRKEQAVNDPFIFTEAEAAAQYRAENPDAAPLSDADAAAAFYAAHPEAIKFGDVLDESFISADNTINFKVTDDRKELKNGEEVYPVVNNFISLSASDAWFLPLVKSNVLLPIKPSSTKSIK